MRVSTKTNLATPWSAHAVKGLLLKDLPHDGIHLRFRIPLLKHRWSICRRVRFVLQGKAALEPYCMHTSSLLYFLFAQIEYRNTLFLLLAFCVKTVSNIVQLFCCLILIVSTCEQWSLESQYKRGVFVVVWDMIIWWSRQWHDWKKNVVELLYPYE